MSNAPSSRVPTPDSWPARLKSAWMNEMAPAPLPIYPQCQCPHQSWNWLYPLPVHSLPCNPTLSCWLPRHCHEKRHLKLCTWDTHQLKHHTPHSWHGNPNTRLQAARRLSQSFSTTRNFLAASLKGQSSISISVLHLKTGAEGCVKGIKKATWKVNTWSKLAVHTALMQALGYSGYLGPGSCLHLKEHNMMTSWERNIM